MVFYGPVKQYGCLGVNRKIIIIIKVRIMRKILSVETTLSAYTHARAHTHIYKQTNTRTQTHIQRKRERDRDRDR